MGATQRQISTLPSLFRATLYCLSRSLRSKRFVWFRSKERPRNGIFGFGRVRNGTRIKKWKRGEREGKEGMKRLQTNPLSPLYSHHFPRVLWLSLLVLCSETARKCFLHRLSLTPYSICDSRETSSSASTVVVDTGLSAYLQSHPSAARRSSSHTRWQETISSVSIPIPRPTSVTEKPRPHYFKFQLLPGKFLKIKFDRLALLALMDR